MSRPLFLLETARLLGHYRHAELVGYESLAPRALEAADGTARELLLRCASSHAYRAGELERLLPVSATLPDAAALTVGIDDRVERAFGRALEVPDGVLVAALSRVVYPALEASYRTHLERCGPFADPPVALVLRRLLAELAAVRSEAERLATGGGSDLLAGLEDLLSGGARVDADPL